MDPRRTYSTIVSDPDGVVLGAWPDAPPPRFSASTDGTDALTITLPREYGSLGETGEPESDGTLAHGNRVDVYVASPDSLETFRPTALLDVMELDNNALDSFAGRGTHLYRGTIEEWSPDITGGAVSVTVLSLARLLEQVFLPSRLVLTGDPVQIAKALVVAYAPGLVWDLRNPAASDAGPVTAIEFRRDALSGALETLRDLAGAGWFVYVTPQGTVRFFGPDTTSTDHYFTIGHDAANARLTRSGINRRKAVRVVYASGETTAGLVQSGDTTPGSSSGGPVRPGMGTSSVPSGGGSGEGGYDGGAESVALAADYRATDPRLLVIEDGHITDPSDALRLAQLKLEELDRMTLRGQVDVLGGYDIESIAPGDVVQVFVPRASGDSPNAAILDDMELNNAALGGPGGFSDYGAAVVAQVDYDGEAGRATLHLAEPPPTVGRLIQRMMRDLAELRQATVDTRLTRDGDGVLAAREDFLARRALLVAGALTADSTVAVGGGIGLNGAEPVARQEITGSRANTEAALANLLSALATRGDITNSTVA